MRIKIIGPSRLVVAWALVVMSSVIGTYFLYDSETAGILALVWLVQMLTWYIVVTAPSVVKGEEEEFWQDR